MWRSASVACQPGECCDLGGQPGASVRLRRIRPNSCWTDTEYEIRLSQSVFRNMLQEERLALINSLKHDGFAFLPSWRTEFATYEVQGEIDAILRGPEVAARE